MEKGLSVNNGGFKKGIWYYFDEQGKLLKEEDNDLPFTFSFEELIKYLQKQNIPISLGHNQFGFHTSFYTEFENSLPMWRVRWLSDTTKTPNTIEELIIDGKTGKLLKKNYRSFNVD